MMSFFVTARAGGGWRGLFRPPFVTVVGHSVVRWSCLNLVLVGGLRQPGLPYPGIMKRTQQRSGRFTCRPMASTPRKNTSNHRLQDSTRYTRRRPVRITWVGDSLRPEGVRKDFVVAAQFDMFQALAAAEEVAGDIAQVIGFMVRLVDFQQV